MKCRVCDTKTEKFMTFGKMPIANGFLNKNEFSNEYFFDLSPVFCENCATFQIAEQPRADLMFHENYAFYSRTSKKMVDHFEHYAKWVIGTYLEMNSFVVEMGSNDGIMLENFSKRGMRHLGVEPSANVAEEAKKHGINTIIDFFSKTIAKKIVSEHGKADAFIAANVMCHISDLHEIARGVNILLNKKGVLIFEDPYLGDMLEKVSYDQIYDEHVYIFSAKSVINIFEPHGFELIDMLPQITHGGSMRYVFARKGEYRIKPSVHEHLKNEKMNNLHLLSRMERFKNDCEMSKQKLVNKLHSEKNAGHRVVGYGATSKSTTVLNYCQIGPDLIDYIADTTPIKQNKYTPGTHIPVKPYEEFSKQYPDTALLFAWNHKREIMEKEHAFSNSGGNWLTYIDKV